MISEDYGASVSVEDEEAVDVVIMLGDAECSQTRSLVGGNLVNLDSTEAPMVEILADLLDSTVRLVAPTDVSFDVVDLIREKPVPRIFQVSGWLREHRALVFRDGCCRLGSLAMRYEVERGLSVDDVS